MPEHTAVLLGLIGSYLALSELQHKADLAAATGAVVASGGYAGDHHERQRHIPAPQRRARGAQ